MISGGRNRVNTKTNKGEKRRGGRQPRRRPLLSAEMVVATGAGSCQIGYYQSRLPLLSWRRGAQGTQVHPFCKTFSIEASLSDSSEIAQAAAARNLLRYSHKPIIFPDKSSLPACVAGLCPILAVVAGTGGAPGTARNAERLAVTPRLNRNAEILHKTGFSIMSSRCCPHPPAPRSANLSHGRKIRKRRFVLPLLTLYFTLC